MSTQQDAASRSRVPATPQQRLEQIRRELAAERRRITWSSVLSLLIGLLVLGLLTAYFVYGYVELRDLRNPEGLVGTAEYMLDNNLPEVRQRIQEATKQHAPQMIADLSKQALEGLPTGRKSLEKYALDRYEEAATEVISITDEQFRTYIKGNRPRLEKYFKELEKNPQLAEEEMNDLVMSIEKDMQLDMQTGARELLDTLMEVNARLRTLRANQKLTPEEQNERRVVMLLRRIQSENLEPAKLSQLPPAQPLPPRMSPSTGQPRKPAATLPKDKAAPATKPAPKKDGGPDKKSPESSKPSPTPEKKTPESATDKKKTDK